MKKQIITLLICLVSVCSFSQITLHHGDFVAVGDTIVEYYEQHPDSSIDVGEPGPNKIWDFSALKPVATDTLIFVDPKETPFAEDFPNSNIALYSNRIYEAWIFMEHSDSELTATGSGVFVANEKRIDIRNETVIKYPLQYQDKRSNTRSKDEIIARDKFGNDSIKRTRVWDHDTAVDAWGDVILANGIFLSLRLKHTIVFTEFYYKKELDKWVLMNKSETNTSIFYQWWTQDEKTKHPIAQIVMDDAHEKPIIAKFLQASPFVEIINKTETSIIVYPNPAINTIFIDTKQQESYINIYSLSGQLLKNITARNSIEEVDISTLASGIYFIIARNKEGEIIGKSKFIKAN